MSYTDLVLAAARQDLPMTVGIEATWLNPAFTCTGPIPCRADPDVKLFIQAAVDNSLSWRLEPGLVMRVDGKCGFWFITFYVTNGGEHRFYEMSSAHGEVWTGSHPAHGPDTLAEALRTLRTHTY